MVFCTDAASKYLSMLDVIMVDPYPIPNQAAGSVQAALDNVAALGKPIIMVPQAFGGGENWARTPSAQEERIMTYVEFGTTPNTQPLCHCHHARTRAGARASQQGALSSSGVLDAPLALPHAQTRRIGTLG